MKPHTAALLLVAALGLSACIRSGFPDGSNDRSGDGARDSTGDLRSDGRRADGATAPDRSGGDRWAGPGALFVQSALVHTGASSADLVFPNPVGAHNAVIVMVETRWLDSKKTISDTLGNTYTKIIQVDWGWGDRLELWAVFDSKAGPDMITATLDLSSEVAVVAHEYAGLRGDGAGVKATSAVGESKAPDGVTATLLLTAGSQHLVFAAVCARGNGTTAGTNYPAVTAGTGLVQRQSGFGVLTEDALVTGGGVVKVTATMTSGDGSGDWAIAMAAFPTGQ